MISIENLEEIGFKFDRENGGYLHLKNETQIIVRQNEISYPNWNVEILFYNEESRIRNYTGSVAIPKIFDKIEDISNLINSLK